jgi:hypothetical protein
MKHEEGLLLGRLPGCAAVGRAGVDVRPAVPARVATMSDHLVDPVPDDDTWFASAKAAAAAVPPAVEATTWVMAMGLQERDADEAIARRLTLDTDQLCLNEQLRTPWPTELHLLGYEVIGIEACGFHSWLCYDGAASWAHRTLGIRFNAHGLVDELADAQRLGAAAEEPGCGLPPIAWVVAAIAIVDQ